MRTLRSVSFLSVFLHSSTIVATSQIVRVHKSCRSLKHSGDENKAPTEQNQTCRKDFLCKRLLIAFRA